MVDLVCIGPDIGTDHSPVYVSFCHKRTSVTTPKPKTIFCGNDFKEKIDQCFSTFDPFCVNRDNIELKINEMVNLFSVAKSEATKSVSVNRQTSLPEEIICQIRIRKQLLKDRNRCMDSETRLSLNKRYNQANKLVKDLLQRHKEEEREKEIKQMATEKDGAKMWHLINKFRSGQEESSLPLMPLTKQDGSKTETDKEKGQVFAEHLMCFRHHVHLTLT